METNMESELLITFSLYHCAPPLSVSSLAEVDVCSPNFDMKQKKLNNHSFVEKDLFTYFDKTTMYIIISNTGLDYFVIGTIYSNTYILRSRHCTKLPKLDNHVTVL